MWHNRHRRHRRRRRNRCQKAVIWLLDKLDHWSFYEDSDLTYSHSTRAISDKIMTCYFEDDFLLSSICWALSHSVTALNPGHFLLRLKLFYYLRSVYWVRNHGHWVRNHGLTNIYYNSVVQEFSLTIERIFLLMKNTSYRSKSSSQNGHFLPAQTKI